MEFPYVKATFCCTGQEDILDEITKVLEITPTGTRTPASFPIPEFACFEWYLSTGEQNCKTIVSPTKKLLTQLENKADKINRMKSKYAFKTDVIITIHANSKDMPEILFHADMIKFAKVVSAELGLDPYIY